MRGVRSRATAVATLLVAMAAAQVAEAAERLPAACTVRLTQRMPGWSLHEAPAEAAAWSREQAFDPAVARGDFDGNRVADWAALVNVSGEPRLVFCLNSSQRAKLVVVTKPYCADMVYTTRAGSRRFNLESNRHERLVHAGASVSCFGKAGATYVLEKSRVRPIIDAD